MRRVRFRRKSKKSRLRFPRPLYPALGLALAGPALGAWIGLARVGRALPFEGPVLFPVLAGAAVYALLHLIFRKPMTLYVFGHELTHAAAALLSGYKVKSLFVSEKGGEVELSDTNAFVALAPYCVPAYTIAVLLAYGLVRRYAPLAAPPLWVGFGIGLTLAFHLALTVHALRQNQPDLRHAGTFFSLVLIVLSNGLVLAFVLKALFPSIVELSSFFGAWVGDTRLLFERTWEGLSWLGRKAAAQGGWIRGALP
ncbi:MAG: hypothetical protein IPP35_04585 [Elusimicrobia bacterium]|nr:hypothetical protein [Elusimicrobiota bacterium]